MAVDAATVVLDTGEPAPGVWCPRCVLPSAWSAPIVQLTDWGVKPLFRLDICPDCGWEVTGPARRPLE